MEVNERFVLLVGGARSGKSRLAQELAGRAGRPVTFLATATAGDDDMTARIARHRAERPADWDLVEEPLAVVGAVERLAPDRTLILDCLTLWVANLIFDDRPDPAIEREAAALAASLARREGPSLVVSNEVGLGIHPPTGLGRRYQDLLGRVNQLVAARAGRTLFLAAGRAVELVPPDELLADWPPVG
jgi:adenosyl cobinamide kinase/adenosyl cobinamide phosphate guanylyltransferase